MRLMVEFYCRCVAGNIQVRQNLIIEAKGGDMSALRNQLIKDAAARGKYSPLYRHLASMAGPRWRASFEELEAILGFNLPDSARLYRPWWSNQKRSAGHSHALAWQAAGWKTRAVDLESETLVFECVHDPSDDADNTPPAGRKLDFDQIWPAVPGGAWPPGFRMSREQIYDETGRLTGGSQNDIKPGG